MLPSYVGFTVVVFGPLFSYLQEPPRSLFFGLFRGGRRQQEQEQQQQEQLERQQFEQQQQQQQQQELQRVQEQELEQAHSQVQELTSRVEQLESQVAEVKTAKAKCLDKYDTLEMECNRRCYSESVAKEDLAVRENEIRDLQETIATKDRIIAELKVGFGSSNYNMPSKEVEVVLKLAMCIMCILLGGYSMDSIGHEIFVYLPSPHPPEQWGAVGL